MVENFEVDDKVTILMNYYMIYMIQMMNVNMTVKVKDDTE